MYPRHTMWFLVLAISWPQMWGLWVTWADIPSDSEKDYRFYVIKRNDNPAENPFSAPDGGGSGLMQSADSQGYDLTSSSSSTDSTSSGSDQGSGSSPYVYEAHQSFHFMHGTAYLLEKVVNVIIGEQEERMTMTGLHTVADIFCVGCGSIVGCKYEAAFQKRQKYKEGKFVLERYWGLTEATM